MILLIFVAFFMNLVSSTFLDTDIADICALIFCKPNLLSQMCCTPTCASPSLLVEHSHQWGHCPPMEIQHLGNPAMLFWV